jgi:hypothetical protein
MLESLLLHELAEGRPAFWAGNKVPRAGLVSSSGLFDEDADFRLPSVEHGSYHAVYLLEQDLGLHKQWPLILDEALRLFEYGKRGLLFVRFSQTDLLSAFAFAAFLRRRSDFVFTLAYQDESTDGSITYGLYCEREAWRPALASIEFAVITDGGRPDAVARFVASVAGVRGIDLIDWSIAVCGPAATPDKPDLVHPRVRHIVAPAEHQQRGWITAKKNRIVTSSHAETLLIAHDRYEVPPAFLEQLLEFGADFSVIVPAQRDVNGGEFPDWVTIGSQWSRSGAAMLEYGDYSPHGYVNGGVIIAKRRVLAATPWSELLFWGQYEDVELSRAMVAQGITARLARNVRLLVTTARPGYLHDFERMPYLPGAYPLPRYGASDVEKVVGEFSLGDTVTFDRATTAVSLSRIGIVASRAQWACRAAGLVFLKRRATLTVNMPAKTHGILMLTISVPAYQGAMLLRIEANGMPLQLRWSEGSDGKRCASASLEGALAVAAHSLTLTFTVDTDAVLLSTLGIATLRSGVGKVPLGYARVNGAAAGVFQEGWGEPESWGIWTIAPHAHIELPIRDLSTERDIEVSVTATAYAREVGDAQIVGIACNGIALTCVSIPAQMAPVQFFVRIPRALVTSVFRIRLSFSPAFPITPEAAGRGPDGRLLGFGLIALDVRAL